MRLKPIIEELREFCPSFERRVFGIAEYGRIEEGMSVEMPCAFVLPVQETADDPKAQTRYIQDYEFSFRVIVMSSTAEDETGLDAWDKVEALKSEIFKSLVGFDDPQGSDWVTYEGMAIQNLTRAYLAVTFDFNLQGTVEDDKVRHGFDIERLERFKRVHADIDMMKPDGAIEHKIDINLKEES